MEKRSELRNISAGLAEDDKIQIAALFYQRCDIRGRKPVAVIQDQRYLLASGGCPIADGA
ncbi:hypothetical protein [Sinorhizobium medicae]